MVADSRRPVLLHGVENANGERLGGEFFDLVRGDPVEADRVVGYSRFHPTDDADDDPTAVGMIGSIYTLPEVWGTGVGKALMAEVGRRQFGPSRLCRGHSVGARRQ